MRMNDKKGTGEDHQLSIRSVESQQCSCHHQAGVAPSYTNDVTVPTYFLVNSRYPSTRGRLDVFIEISLLEAINSKQK